MKILNSNSKNFDKSLYNLLSKRKNKLKSSSVSVTKIINNFEKNKKSEIITLSTFKKDSISKIKKKLLNYVS